VGAGYQAVISLYDIDRGVLIERREVGNVVWNTYQRAAVAALVALNDANT
jgi:hypothetical protein